MSAVPPVYLVAARGRDASALAQAAPYRELMDQALGALGRHLAARADPPFEQELVAERGPLQPQPLVVEENL